MNLLNTNGFNIFSMVFNVFFQWFSILSMVFNTFNVFFWSYSFWSNPHAICEVLLFPKAQHVRHRRLLMNWGTRLDGDATDVDGCEICTSWYLSATIWDYNINIVVNNGIINDYSILSRDKASIATAGFRNIRSSYIPQDIARGDGWSYMGYLPVGDGHQCTLITKIHYPLVMTFTLRHGIDDPDRNRWFTY